RPGGGRAGRRVRLRLLLGRRGRRGGRRGERRVLVGLRLDRHGQGDRARLGEGQVERDQFTALERVGQPVQHLPGCRAGQVGRRPGRQAERAAQDLHGGRGGRRAGRDQLVPVLRGDREEDA